MSAKYKAGQGWDVKGYEQPTKHVASAPSGDLTVLREYSCGCIIYLDASKQEINEKGIFCGQGPWYRHRDLLVKGQETQPDLFSAG